MLKTQVYGFFPSGIYEPGGGGGGLTRGRA
jgi:hypothetical protein